MPRQKSHEGNQGGVYTELTGNEGTPQVPAEGTALTTGEEGNGPPEAAVAAEGTPPEDGENPGGIPPENNENPPDSPPKIPPRADNGKKRIKCEELKGRKITVGKGIIVRVDENGILEVDADEAERLLTIPGYENV
jgi:hypothetical protein